MVINYALPSPFTLRQQIPASAKTLSFVEKSRETLMRILDGIDDRLIIILGPCSIHHTPTAKEYAQRLKALAERVSDRFVLVLRAHFEKPRTRLGWKGLLYDPHLDGTDELATGLSWVRQFCLDIANMGLPLSTEFLDPSLTDYYSDLVSWGQIGARTSESQVHRQMASGLPLPIGFKNRPDGSIDVAINAVVAASQPQSYFSRDLYNQPCRIQTSGNPDCAVVLRGGSEPNYDRYTVSDTVEKLRQLGQTARLLIDCSHDNCQRSPCRQLEVFRQVFEQSLESPQNIAGLMLESYISKGNQTHHRDPRLLDPTISLTDPCISWEDTETLIWEAHQKAKAAQSTRSLIRVH